MRRDDVASMFIQRHFGTRCPLGWFLQLEMIAQQLLPEQIGYFHP